MIVFFAQFILQPTACGWTPDEACAAMCKPLCTQPAQYVPCKPWPQTTPSPTPTPSPTQTATPAPTASPTPCPDCSPLSAELAAKSAELDSCRAALSTGQAQLQQCSNTLAQRQRWLTCMKKKCPATYKRCVALP